MTEKETTPLQSRLLTRKATLHDEIRAGLARAKVEGSAELSGESHDLGDESFADLATDVVFAEVRRDIAELRDVEAALQRMDQGIYGICAACGDSIAPNRLEANPAARHCLKCEAAREGAGGRAREARSL